MSDLYVDLAWGTLHRMLRVDERNYRVYFRDEGDDQIKDCSSEIWRLFMRRVT